jgi:ribonuclease Z
MQFDLAILGSNGAVPAFGRHPSSQILNYNSHLYMVDCGETAQFNLTKYGIKRGKLDHIFISHLHGDHFYGLMGLLTSFNLNWRDHDLHVFGPPGLKEIIDLHFKHSQTILKYQLVFHPTQADKPEVIYKDSFLSVETIPLKHRIPTTGFLFREHNHLLNIRPEKIKEYNIPFSVISGIKQGHDFTLENGTIISNEELTLPPGKPRSYAYCSDTAFVDTFLEQISGIDTLYHEATFINEHEARATETFHSTGRQAAQVAKAANVGQLIIGHFSARYEDLNPLLHEAKAVFPNTFLADEGRIFAIR